MARRELLLDSHAKKIASNELTAADVAGQRLILDRP
jgi:hypothetical protein